jgi:cell division septation protein DedD
MPKSALLLPLSAAAAIALAGCGSSGPNLPADIPQLNAQNLNAYLVRAQQACTLHDGARLRDMAHRYAAAVTDLPPTVDAQVLTVLRKGADSLKSLARTGDGCDIGASGASGVFGAKTTTTPEVASTPAPAPTPTPKHSKPKPKPKPAKAAKPPKPPKPEPPAQPAPTPASGNQGGGSGDQGNGNQGGGSGGIGVGPTGKSAKAAR